MSLTNINNAKIRVYNDAVHRLLDQEGSLLRKFFKAEQMKSEAQYFSIIQNFQASRVTNKYATVDYTDVQHTKRLITSTLLRTAQLLNEHDLNKTNLDIKGEYMMKSVNALGIEMDEIIVEAILGSATEELSDRSTQTTSLSLNIAKDISGSDTGLTVEKIIRANRLLNEKSGGTRERKILIINPACEETLLNQDKATNTDYVVRQKLENGVISSFMGFDIVVLKDGILTGAGTTGDPYKCIAITDQALKIGIWKDVSTIYERVATLDSYQLLSKLEMGCVRMDEDRALTIECVTS